MIQIDHTAYPKRLRTLPVEFLRYIIADATEALQCYPNGQKSGYYADEINYASDELRRRQLA